MNYRVRDGAFRTGAELGVVERYAASVLEEGWQYTDCGRGEICDGEADAVAAK